MSEWIKCSDRSPEPRTMVLFESRSLGTFLGFRRASNGRAWVGGGGYTGGSLFKDVTHWQPLPEPPRE